MMMTTRRFVARHALVALALVVVAPSTASAHDVLYTGTVLSVEAVRLQVKTVDPDTKKDVTLWFGVTKDTKVKRGDTPVPYAEAKIAKDERIVVVVNHDEGDSNHVAAELRLAARR